MESVHEFEAKLVTAVDARRRELDSRQLTRLNKDLQMMVTASNTISSALAKKSVFHNSSIRYDEIIDDIVPPSLDSIPEDREKIYVVGTRFGQYIAMLEYAVQHYQFSCVFLTPPRISKLNALLQSFNWDSFNVSSENPNTRAFAEIVQDFKRCGDKFAIGVVVDSVSQLATTLSSALKALKVLSAFQREAYKLEVRTSVLPRTGLREDAPPSNDSLKTIKKAFGQSMHGAPFYTDLIKEILEENSGENAASKREDALFRLESEDQSQKKKKAEVQEDYRAWLIDAIRALGGASQQLVAIVNKLSENLKIYQDSQVTFFSKVKDLFRAAFNMPTKEVEITINVTNPANQKVKRETIQFNSFIETLKKRAQLFNAFTVKNSAVRQKLTQMTDQQIFDTLSASISDINTILRQCVGIDEFFKTAVNDETKSRIKGIKIEISAIQNTIHKANRLRADYSARIEEKEQLKRLGIG